jgi:hypothetical protein
MLHGTVDWLDNIHCDERQLNVEKAHRQERNEHQEDNEIWSI